MANRAERWLLQLMAGRAQDVLEATLAVVVLEDHGSLQVAAQSGRGSVATKVVPARSSALGDLYRAHEPLALENPLGDQAAFMRELGLESQAVLVQPLGIDGPGGGMIIVVRSDSGLRKGDESALGAVAASLTQHLLAERTAEVERLRYGAHSRERERERWARELHDETIQGLGALRMQLANARDSGDPDTLLEAVRKVVNELEHEVMGIRHLITELRPAALDDLGLEAALQALARRAHDVYGLAVDVEVGAFGGTEPDSRLDPELETTIYRITQEALNNVARHAEATHASISVAKDNGDVVATVADDGKGMPDSQSARDARASRENGQAGPQNGHAGGGSIPTGGFGLPGMQERADLVGGEIEVSSAPGRGTRLSLRVPLAGRPQEAPGAEEVGNL